MNKILMSYVDKFVDDFELENNISDNFELFAAYSIISTEIINPDLELSELESLSVKKSKGIDCIAIVINNKLTTTIEELEDLLGTKMTAHIDIIFIQAKTSEKFEEKEISNFADTINDFLDEDPTFVMTSQTKNYHDMLLLIYEKFAYIHSLNVKAFYTTSGKWLGNSSAQTTLLKKESEIRNKDIFKNGKFELIPCDMNLLIKYYNKATSPLKAKFKLDKIISLSNLHPNIKQAYIGLIDLEDFRQIISDPDTSRLRSLFYDNVRDDLGIDNQVNKKISSTLEEKKYSLFPLLNNGVTIIAENNNGVGNIFDLDNFQIVNGCQTSNVIFNHLNDEGINQLVIPIKLIITTDAEIKDEIIIATNQQTEVKDEQLIALSSFQKDLERYYKSNSDGLYYERRTNQYKGSTIKMKNIVNLREQIKSFVAIFMEEPHLASGYFGKIYKLHKEKLFQDTHKHQPYYFAGFIQYKFKELLNKKMIDRKYNKIRYHIFMLYRKIHEPEKFKFELLSKKKQSYIDDLILSLSDDVVFKNFNKSLELINNSGIDIENSKEIYLKSTTNKLLDKFKEVYK